MATKQRWAPSLSASASLSAVGWLTIFGIGYAAAAAIDDLLIAGPGGVPPISLAAGFAVGMLVRVPARVFAWAMATQAAVGLAVLAIAGLTAALAVSVGVQVVACAVMASLLRVIGVRKITSLGGLGSLSAVVAGVALFAALGIALAEATLNSLSSPDTVWTLWFATVSGVALVAPGVLAAHKPRRITSNRVIELAAVVVAGSILMAAILLGHYDSTSVASSAQYLLIPLLLWIALRFGLAVVGAALVAVDSTALLATAAGLGPYSIANSLGGSVVGLQLAMLVTALAVYSVAVNEERRRTTEYRLLATRGVVDSLLANSDARISVKEYRQPGKGVYTLANPRFALLFGRSVPQVIGRTDADLADAEVASQAVAEDLEVLESRTPKVFITRRPDTRSGSGRCQILLVTKFPLEDAEREVMSVGAIALDITEHRRRERMMRLTFDQSPIPMARLAWRDGRAAEVLDANRSLAELLGVPVPDLLGGRLDRFVRADERGVELVAPEGEDSRRRRREVRLQVGEGRQAWVAVTANVVEPEDADGPEEAFALVTIEDVTARRVAEQTLTHQALHDALTGVLNRHALMDRLQAALNRLWRDSSYVAVLFCDLDGFKHLNDTLGHRAGDQMLVNVSERLRAVMRPQDAVGRLGGDEFVLVCEDLPSPGQAGVIGERIRAAMRAPFRLDGREYGVTASIGIATTTDPKAKPEDLLRRADLAMYRAKDIGRNRVEYYVEELETRAVTQLEATEILRRALAEDRITVHYQPIIQLDNGRTVGFEALVRLVGDDGQLVRPARFIDVAEASGLVVPMGERVLDIALDQLEHWRSRGEKTRMSVNVSPRQLARAGFAPAVFERLLARGLPPDSLTLEVTEAAVVDATGPTLLTLRRLRSYGVHVGIDDFGTGYSSLTTLKYLPADVLKVDRSFVDGLGSDRQDAAIVGAVIKIAHDLDRVVVAEGVETEIQERALRAMGCDLVQGFRYGEPKPCDDLVVGAQAWRSDASGDAAG